MAVYVKRRRIVLLVVICFIVYLIFNLIIIGRSMRKSRDVSLENIEENSLLSSHEAEVDMPGDYNFKFNNDDYFLSEEETLLNTDNYAVNLQNTRQSKLHSIVPTKVDIRRKPGFFQTNKLVQKVEVAIEKPELYHTNAGNDPEFDAFELKDFEAFGTTNIRIYPPVEIPSKEPFPLLKKMQGNIVHPKAPTLKPEHSFFQKYPVLMKETSPITDETNPENAFDAYEITDFNTLVDKDARTLSPIGPDSIIPIPQKVLDQKTIFHSKAPTIPPLPLASLGYPEIKSENQSMHLFLTNKVEVLKVTEPTDHGVLSLKVSKEIATVPNQQHDQVEQYDIKNLKNGKSEFPTTDIKKRTKNPALIIDTFGCKIPKFNPWDPTVMNFIQIFGPYICPFPPLFMKPAPNGIINLNASVLNKHYNATPNDTKCWYQAIVRTYLSTNNREDDYYVLPVQELKFEEPIEHEHIIAKCFFPNYTHEQYIPLVKLKDEVEQRKSVLKTPSPLNVILLGIDSVSKLNFMRRFFMTKAYLKFHMKAFDMKGFTKVGDNTFPNLVPLLTGHFVDYFWNESIKDTFYFDNVSLIWKEYAQYGHRTFFAEDAPYNGAFNFLKRGFLEPPADYYYRPLALAIEQSDLRKKGFETNSACLNSELETDIMYDYLVNFIKTMGKRPYFAFCMTSTLTHDFFDAAGFADAPAERLLKVLDDEGALNSSAFVIFSDHGIRYGEIRQTYIGKFEERMPFMYIHFPKWFLNQHPDFERNLAINQDRLVTMFDIHATLKHLLQINEGYIKENNELGLSLLNEIPENRTCADAHIQEHYCPCNTFNTVSVDKPEVFMVSVALVDHINSLLVNLTDVCEVLTLDEIKDARLGLPNEIVLKLEEEEDLLINKTQVIGEAPPTLGDYLITLSVKPGGALFEGTIRYDAKNLTPKVFGVSRINMYGKQSWCIDSQKLKLFCYCKVQQI